MFKKFKLTCNEATTICDKAQYGEASFYEKIQLNWHLIVCKICKTYTTQNSKMSDLFKMKAANCKSETKCLSNQDKDILKEKLRQLN